MSETENHTEKTKSSDSWVIAFLLLIAACVIPTCADIGIWRDMSRKPNTDASKAAQLAIDELEKIIKQREQLIKDLEKATTQLEKATTQAEIDRIIKEGEALKQKSEKLR